MVKKCSKCNKQAISFIRYNGTHLCKQHFISYFEKRVKREIKKQGKIDKNSEIGIAVSGGKDSIIAMFMMHKLFSNRPNLKLFCISVDEGIDNYRNKSLIYAKKNAESLDIPYHVISFKDVIQTTMDEISKKTTQLGECSYCGVFRRVCLNQKAKELGVKKLVTGHNLDDMAQSILMNFVNGDIQKLARLGPHLKVQPGLIPRMMPLRVIPEKEVTLYAIINNIEFFDGECPYAVNALRGYFRDIIDGLEYKSPGTRHSILNSYDNIKEILIKKYPPVKLNRCSICGEPTSQKLCKACILKQKIKD